MKLPKDAKKATDESEGGFKPIPGGIYTLQLLKVEASDGDGPSGYPYWTWVFQIPEDEPEYAKRQFRQITSLSPKAAFKMRETYDAFQVGTDTDTEELVGHKVTGRIGETTIQSGDRAGEPSNEILELLPLEDIGGDEEF